MKTIFLIIFAIGVIGFTGIAFTENNLIQPFNYSAPRNERKII